MAEKEKKMSNTVNVYTVINYIAIYTKKAQIMDFIIIKTKQLTQPHHTFLCKFGHFPTAVSSRISKGIL